MIYRKKRTLNEYDVRVDQFPYQSIQSSEVGIDYRVSAAYLNDHPEQIPGYRYLPHKAPNE